MGSRKPCARRCRLTDPSRIWWTRRVRDAVAVKGAARAVLYALADRADEDGVAWPGQAQIALDAGLTDRGVRKVLPELVASGHLERVGSRHNVDIWKLTIDASGNPTGEHRNVVPAERGSGGTGTSFQEHRNVVPEAPERGSYKVPMKGPMKDPGKGPSRAPDPDVAPEQEAVDRLLVAWTELHPTASLDDARHLHGALLNAVSDDGSVEAREAVVLRALRFIAHAADKRGAWGNTPSWLREKGSSTLRIAVDKPGRFDRWRDLCRWSEAWWAQPGVAATVEAMPPVASGAESATAPAFADEAALEAAQIVALAASMSPDELGDFLDETAAEAVRRIGGVEALTGPKPETTERLAAELRRMEAA